jgi:hypothetical protein
MSSSSIARNLSALTSSDFLANEQEYLKEVLHDYFTSAGCSDSDSDYEDNERCKLKFTHNLQKYKNNT